MAKGDANQVVYVDGDVPQLPLQLGQLLVDKSEISTGVTNLQQCTSQNPLVYSPVQGGYPITAAEQAAGVTPSSYLYPPLDMRRYGWQADDQESSASGNDAALTAALAVAAQSVGGGQGCALLFPLGVGYYSSTKNMGNRVSFIGAGKRGTILRAVPGFSGTYMLTVDNGTSSTFDNRLQALTLDCNDVASLGGVLSEAWQEGGGLLDVLVRRFRTYGIDFQVGDGGAAVCEIDQSELFGSSSGAFAAVRINATSSFQVSVSNSTLAGDGAGVLPRAIDLVTGSLALYNAHFETCTSSVYVDGAGSPCLDFSTGSTSNVTNLIEIASTFTGYVVTRGSRRTGATNFLVDNRIGGKGTITGVDPPDLVIAPVGQPPLFTIGATWSSGLFDGTAGSPTLSAGFNVASITKNGTGDYTITETRGLSSANSRSLSLCSNLSDATYRTDNLGTSTYRLRITVAGVATDASQVHFSAIRLE